MNKYDKEYYKKQKAMSKAINSYFDRTIFLLASNASIENISEKNLFLFANYPRLEKKINKEIQIQLAYIDNHIRKQTADIWGLSNTKNDILINQRYSKIKTPTPKTNHYQPQLKEYLSRDIAGKTLSQRVWNLSKPFKAELESALQAGIDNRLSPQQLAKEIQKYLNNPDMRFRRIRDRYGNLKLSKNALKYNPGQGVYRNSRANALRLARETLNRAYREADYLRWKDMSFVIGFEIRNTERSNTVCDMCKERAGKYPKNFKFIGWHVGCMCTAVPITVSDDDFVKLIKGEDVKIEKIPLPKYLEL